VHPKLAVAVTADATDAALAAAALALT